MGKLLPKGYLAHKIFVPTLVIFMALVGTNSEAYGSPFDSDIIFVASQYKYVREKTNHNDAPEIDTWLKFVGLDNKGEIKRTGTGYSWCAAYGISMYNETYQYHNKKSPLYRSARCSEVYKMAKKDKYTYTVIPAKKVLLQAEDLHEADIVIWSHKKKAEYDWNGHFGLVMKRLDVEHFQSIEGNTVGTDAPDGQREQTKGSKNMGGVFVKTRSLNPNYDFNPEGFIRINKE